MGPGGHAKMFLNPPIHYILQIMADTGAPFFIGAMDLQAAASVLSFGCSGAAQGFFLAKVPFFDDGIFLTL